MPAIVTSAVTHVRVPGSSFVPRPSEVQRNVGLDLVAALGIGSSMAVVGALLPAVARREGLDPLGLAALAALPFLASLLSLLAGRIGPRTPARLGLLRAAGSAGLLLVLVAPQPLFIAIAMFGFWAAMSLGGPLQQRLWATLYPSAARGRVLGIIGSGRSAAGMAALLAFTFATGTGWLPIIAVVAVSGIACAAATSRLRVHGDVEGDYSARESVTTVLRLPMLRRITFAQLVFGGGMVAAPALIAMVQVDRLGLAIEAIAMAGLMGSLATTLTFGFWGRLAGRTGALSTMTLGTLLGTLAMAGFALAPDLASILVASAVLGSAGAAIDVSWPLLIADHAGRHEQSAAAAGLGAIMGIRGLVTPFVVVAPIHAGIVDETGGLLVCTLAAGAGALMYVRLSGIGRRASRAVGGRAFRDVVRRASRAVGGRAAGALGGAARLPWMVGRMGRLWSDRDLEGAAAQSSPASALMPSSSSSGWPVSRRSRLMRSTMAGWVLKRPLALLSSFLMGLTT
jgi:MFS family permease